jgi:sensor domain CHASE-containing protein
VTRVRWKETALLALAYFATARLSLLVAIPPGYSTIVWPAAGVALGALFIWGLDLWPGVCAGSWAANAAMVWSHGNAGREAYLLSAWIGVGAAAQAVAAAALTRRALGGRAPLDEDKDLLRFLLLGGPVACVLSSAWSLIGMRLLGAIGPGELIFSWTTWWTGDSIGVACAAPLVLLWSGRGKPGPRRGRLAVTAALAATLAGAAVLQQFAIRQEERSLRDRAEMTLSDLSLTVRVGLAGHLDAVQSAADFFSSAGAITRGQFEHYAQGTLARHPGMQALEWRPRVSAASRRAVEAAARREGLAGFRFTELDAGGRVVPRALASEYYPILYAEPLRGNEKALGFDISHIQPQIHAAAVRALATGLPTASGGVRLVQETGGQTGVVVLMPVRRAGDAEPSGLVEGVFRIGDMMEVLLSGVDAGTLGVNVYDDTPPGPPELLYSRPLICRSTIAPLSTTGNFGGRLWRIQLIPNSDFEMHPRATLSWFSLFGSLLFAYMIAWVVLTLYGRGEKARIGP